MKATALEKLAGGLRQKPILLGASLILVTLLLYGRVAHYEFLVFDDKPYITQNDHINTGLKVGNVVWAFTSFREGNWHPITWLSHMADCQWFGLNSGHHHLVNLALHAANVLLLFWLLQTATGAVWRSFFVAALFAMHPMNVETVAWVAERKSLLSAFFSLLTIAAYGWYVRRPSWRKYTVLVLGFSMALMSKPMAVSLPFVLLMVDYWPLKRYESLPFRTRWARLSIEKAPLFLMSAASSIVTMMAQRSGGAMADTSVVPLPVRLGNAVISYVAYIGKAVWPSKLSVFYPHPERAWPLSDVIAASVILIAITAAVFYFHRARYLAMGWCLFVVTLVPVIGIVQVGRQALADRYVYIPCIGLFIIVAWGLNDLVSAASVPRPVAAIVALAVISGLMLTTNNYLSYWQNGIKLFTRASLVANQPDFMIEDALADALATSGRYNEAYQHYGNACVLRPRYPLCHYNMGQILFTRHQLQDALQQLQLAGSLTDNKDLAVSCLINSGEILLALGDYQTAQTRLDAALQIDPKNGVALQLRQRALTQSSANP